MTDKPQLPEPVGVIVVGTQAMRAFTADQAQAYADACVAADREDAWQAVNHLIKTGPLPGNGWDQQAERNGIVLAANILMARWNEIDAAILKEPK